MKNHQKHATIAPPEQGHFGRKEWAIVGTPCSNIKKLAFDLTELLSKQYKIAYVDADHAAALPPPDAIRAGAMAAYMDKIDFHRFDFLRQPTAFEYRQRLNEMDIVLVNGNHFQAKQQIVVIDPQKETSLKKRLAQLTDVQLILLINESEEVYPFLKTQLGESHLPIILPFSDTAAIANFLLQKLQDALPPIYGLALAGGESLRMGQDKGLLDYHGKPQREYLAALLSENCEKTFLSCRPQQLMDTSYPILADTFLNLGPFGAILSAFRQYPNAAWLVAACDLPLLDKATVQQLLKNRNPSKLATAFQNPETQLPEPLITIWEPKAYPVLLQFLGQGYSCPRKVLIHNDIELLQIEQPNALQNVNTPEEMEKVKSALAAEKAV